jgi:hypothetical protein
MVHQTPRTFKFDKPAASFRVLEELRILKMLYARDTKVKVTGLTIFKADGSVARHLTGQIYGIGQQGAIENSISGDELRDFQDTMPASGDDYNHFKRGNTYYTLAYEKAFEGDGAYVWEGDLELV